MPKSNKVIAKRLVYIYSPTPPIKSGTAHYLELILKQISKYSLQEYDFVFVIDKKLYEQQAFGGDDTYTVVDFRTVKRTKEDVTMYFLANNEFHRYVHRSLYDHLPEHGVAVSVVHEPDMWMNIQAMCNLRQYGFNEDDIEYFARYEFGDDTGLICDLFKRGATDINFEYTSVAGTHIYERSDYIVFHSPYALEKFTLEMSSTYRSIRVGEPKYLIMDHPPEDFKEDKLISKKKNKFIVGTFGWAQKVKQTDSIILGFDAFYRGLDKKDKDLVGLNIVGQVDISKGFDPFSTATNTSCPDKIKFYGYVTDDEMNKLMSETSLMFSLRFPSCGETSGPLRKATRLGVSVVLSDYAAFADEPAAYHLSVKKSQQDLEIVEVLKKEFNRFKLGKSAKKIGSKPKANTIKAVIDTVMRDKG